MTHSNNYSSQSVFSREPRTSGRIVGQKPPLKLKEVWWIRTHPHLARKIRDLALFNLAIDSKLRACDLVSIRVSVIATGRQVQFEITQQTRDEITSWMDKSGRNPTAFFFQVGSITGTIYPHDSTRDCWTNGLAPWAWIRGATALIPSARQRSHTTIRRPATIEPSSCCSDT